MTCPFRSPIIEPSHVLPVRIAPKIHTMFSAPLCETSPASPARRRRMLCNAAFVLPSISRSVTFFLPVLPVVVLLVAELDEYLAGHFLEDCLVPVGEHVLPVASYALPC